MTDLILLEKALAPRFGEITDDVSLRDALYELLDRKSDTDAELIGESADMLAALSGETDEMTDASIDSVRMSLSARIAAERAVNREREDTGAVRDEKILRPKRGIKWKLLIPIAAAVILLASLAAMTFAGSGRLADITNAFWKLINPGEKIVESDYELKKDVDHRGYEEFEAMLEAEGITGVLAPKGMTVSDPLVVEYGDYREITATFTDADGRNYDYEAQYPSQSNVINAELTRIGAFDVSLSHYDDVYQAEFISDGVWYVIGTNDQEALTAFVAALGR